MFCEVFLFTNFSQGKFLYCSMLFILTTNFNTAVLLMKYIAPDFFLVKIVAGFVKLLNINLDEYTFSQSCKISFF